MGPDREKLRGIVEKLNLANARRHIFLCTGPNCCTPEQGLATWEYLKRRIKELGPAVCPVNRTKVHCNRICCEGPTAVVYPEGTWYCHVSPEVCEEILQKHLLGGEPVQEYVFAAHPLPSKGLTTEAQREQENKE